MKILREMVCKPVCKWYKGFIEETTSRLLYPHMHEVGPIIYNSAQVS